jgi:hypothetical protein
MNILRRRVPAAEAVGKNGLAEATVNQRIMVTVERETATVLVRGQAEPVQTIEGEPAGGRDEPESRQPKLLPPASENNEKDCP